MHRSAARTAVLLVATVATACAGSPTIEHAAPAPPTLSRTPILLAIPTPTVEQAVTIPPELAFVDDLAPIDDLAPAADEVGSAEDAGSDPCAGDVSVQVLADQFDTRTDGWAGGDLMDVVDLGDGRRVWIFGDSFIGAVSGGALDPGHRFVHSSAFVQKGTCFEMVQTDDGWGWVSWPPDGTWLWPQEATLDRGLLHVFMVRVQNLPGAAPGLNFEVVGGALAVFALDDLTDPLIVVADTPTVDGKPFGWSTMNVRGFHYVYSHVQGRGSFVARVPEGLLANFSFWAYWNGTDWVPDPSAAVAVDQDRLRVSVLDDGSLEALTIRFGGERVLVSTSSRPEGPFTAVEELAIEIDTELEWAYQPLAVRLADSVAIAFNTLPWDPTRINNDVLLYGPTFVDRYFAGADAGP